MNYKIGKPALSYHMEEPTIKRKKTYPATNQLCQQLGANIRKLRRRNHLTQENLSEIVFSTQKYISKIETGYGRPSLELCIRITGALHVSLDELLRGGEEAENANGNLQEQKLYDDIILSSMQTILRAERCIDTLQRSAKPATSAWKSSFPIWQSRKA